MEYVGVPKSYKWQNTNNLVRQADRPHVTDHSELTKENV